MLPRVPRPGRWAALSAAAPLLILIVAYWRLQQFEIAFAWTLAALALAGLELGAAFVVAQRRTAEANPEIEIALAAYAVGVLGGTITAAAFGLGEAWLTVALAAHLPAIGWVETRIRVAALRWVALAIASAVLVRLILNPYVLDYPLGTTPILNWLLYGYGVPAAAFVVATRQFGSSRDDALVWVLEAGSIAFSLLLLTLELIHALYGRLTMHWLDDFGDGAALTALWFVFAAAVIALGEYRQRPVLRWGGRLLLAVATVFSVLWQLLGLLFGVPVGDLPVLNGLLLADAVPALVYARPRLAGAVPPEIAHDRARAGGRLRVAWVTLEIKPRLPHAGGTVRRQHRCRMVSVFGGVARLCRRGAGAGPRARQSMAAPRRADRRRDGGRRRCFCPIWPNSAACCGPCRLSASAARWSGSATPTGASARCSRPTEPTAPAT